MADTILNRFTIGAGKLIDTDHTGPASYTTGGEVLGAINNQTGMTAVGLGSIDMVLVCGISISGNYTVASQPSGSGVRKTFNLLWSYAAASGGVTGVTASGSPTGMTAGTYALAFSGGGGSGAAGTITVTATAVTSIVITDPGSGYVTPPSVSAATGGTPPTLTATIGDTSAAQVATGTNLTGETVRLGYVGR